MKRTLLILPAMLLALLAYSPVLAQHHGHHHGDSAGHRGHHHGHHHHGHHQVDSSAAASADTANRFQHGGHACCMGKSAGQGHACCHVKGGAGCAHGSTAGCHAGCSAECVKACKEKGASAFKVEKGQFVETPCGKKIMFEGRDKVETCGFTVFADGTIKELPCHTNTLLISLAVSFALAAGAVFIGSKLGA